MKTSRINSTRRAELGKISRATRGEIKGVIEALGLRQPQIQLA